MSAPKRIQMSRQKPWRADNPDAVIVARPGQWGNPYTVGDYHSWFTRDELGPILCQREITAPVAVALYREQLVDEVVGAPSLAAIKRELKGKDLACWCAVDQPCHADVLLELANA